MKQGSYKHVLLEAVGLLDFEEWDEDSEYLRGMSELIARVFVDDLDTEAKAVTVRAEIYKILERLNNIEQS